MTAAEFARSVRERHKRERQQRWRAWVTPCAIVMVALILAGNGILRATVQESWQWWIGGCAVFIAIAISFPVIAVSLVDLYRDGRDFIKLRRLIAQERDD